MPSIIALIPARAGSKRIPGKATKILGGKPLIRWTVEAAEASGIFSAIVVCADTREIIHASGAANAWLRPDVPDHQPDIEWVRAVMGEDYRASHDAFSILRPTSPFRTGQTIQRAWEQFQKGDCHSLRAVQPVREHPGKMWVMGAKNRVMTPFQPQSSEGTPTHSRATQSLPPVYVQNASLEIAWTYVVKAFDTISGTKVLPFFTSPVEGFDINTQADWEEAERIMAAIQR